MRISGDFMRVVGEYSKNKKVSNVGNVKGVEKKDTMSISNEARDYNVARKAIREVPDIRQEKVSRLEQMYASGTYNVSGKDIADKLADKLIDKKI